MRQIKLVKHNNQWHQSYLTEATKFRELLGHVLITSHHIGSTAIKNIYAKPIIDILLEVANLVELDAKEDSLVSIGCEPKGEHGIKDRRYFRKGDDKRTHHVHVFEENHPEIQRHLLFRDYLNGFPDEAKRACALGSDHVNLLL